MFHSQNILYSSELYTYSKRTVKTRSCPRQTQMPLIVLSLSSPNIQALANAPFLNESSRWYIPLIRLQDMKTCVNKNTHTYIYIYDIHIYINKKIFKMNSFKY